jgi:hypothetical protein
MTRYLRILSIIQFTPHNKARKERFSPCLELEILATPADIAADVSLDSQSPANVSLARALRRRDLAQESILFILVLENGK